jgi:hypothetical protein
MRTPNAKFLHEVGRSREIAAIRACSGFWRWGGLGFVGSGVVFSAEQLCVGEVGVASVYPVDDVVCVAP